MGPHNHVHAQSTDDGRSARGSALLLSPSIFYLSRGAPVIDHDRVCLAAQQLADAATLQTKTIMPLFISYGIDEETLGHLIEHVAALAPWLQQESFVVGVLIALIASDYAPESITESDFEELLRPQ